MTPSLVRVGLRDEPDYGLDGNYFALHVISPPSANHHPTPTRRIRKMLMTPPWMLDLTIKGEASSPLLRWFFQRDRWPAIL